MSTFIVNNVPEPAKHFLQFSSVFFFFSLSLSAHYSAGTVNCLSAFCPCAFLLCQRTGIAFKCKLLYMGVSFRYSYSFRRHPSHMLVSLSSTEKSSFTNLEENSLLIMSLLADLTALKPPGLLVVSNWRSLKHVGVRGASVGV